MGDMAPECYVVAAGWTGHVAEHDFHCEAPIKILPVFSSRDLARSRIRDSGSGQSAEPKEVNPGELRQILMRARSEGYTHVALDGRQMRIDGFTVFLDHEQLD